MKLITRALEIVGIALVAVGAAMVYLPSAFMVAGVGCLVVSAGLWGDR